MAAGRLAAAASVAALVSLVAAGPGSAANRCPVTTAAVSKAVGVPMRLTDAPPSGNFLCAFSPRSATAAYPALNMFGFPDPHFKVKTLAQMRALYKAFPAVGLTELGGGAFMAKTESSQIFIELYSAHVKLDAYFANGYGSRRSALAMRTLFATFR